LPGRNRLVDCRRAHYRHLVGVGGSPGVGPGPPPKSAGGFLHKPYIVLQKDSIRLCIWAGFWFGAVFSLAEFLVKWINMDLQKQLEVEKFLGRVKEWAMNTPQVSAVSLGGRLRFDAMP